MSKIAETLVNEALDAVDLAREKVSALVDYIEGNELGEPGSNTLSFIESELSKKMIAAYSSLEDLYGYAEDLGDAP